MKIGHEIGGRQGGCRQAESMRQAGRMEAVREYFMRQAEIMRQAGRIEAGREYDAGSEDEGRTGGWRQQRV